MMQPSCTFMLEKVAGEYVQCYQLARHARRTVGLLKPSHIYCVGLYVLLIALCSRIGREHMGTLQCSCAEESFLNVMNVM